MKIKGLVLTALLAAATVITGCGGQEGGTSNVGGSNGAKIVVGLDDEFPPMGFRDDKNEITGFDVDLAKEAARRLGREVEFKAIDWSSKEAELKSKRIDVLWNGLDITPERQENMLFSDPYMDNRQIVFVRHSEEPSNINGEAAVHNQHQPLKVTSMRTKLLKTVSPSLRPMAISPVLSWIWRTAELMPSSVMRLSVATT